MEVGREVEAQDLAEEVVPVADAAVHGRTPVVLPTRLVGLVAEATHKRRIHDALGDGGSGVVVSREGPEVSPDVLRDAEVDWSPSRPCRPSEETGLPASSSSGPHRPSRNP